MTKGKSLREQAAAYAKTQDQTKVTAGADFKLPEAGVTYARLVEYIEVGMQPRPAWKGQAREPVPTALIAFELLGSKHVTEHEGKKSAPRLYLPAMPLLLSANAKFRKFFDKLREGNETITHISQLLGEAFKVTIVHNVVGEGKDAKTYANITNADGTFLIGPPIKEEYNEDGEVIGTKVVKVREPIGPERLFLWDNPSMEQWNSIFIDGEYETKDAKGKTVIKSKNRYQDKIMAALNFEGSPIQALLEGSEELPEDPEDLEDEVVEEDEEVAEEEEIEEEEIEEAPPVKKQKSVAGRATQKATSSTTKATPKKQETKKSTPASTVSKTKSRSSAKSRIEATIEDDE